MYATCVSMFVCVCAPFSSCPSLFSFLFLCFFLSLCVSARLMRERVYFPGNFIVICTTILSFCTFSSYVVLRASEWTKKLQHNSYNNTSVYYHLFIFAERPFYHYTETRTASMDNIAIATLFLYTLIYNPHAISILYCVSAYKKP